MNKVLKTILKVAEAVAVGTLPGARAVQEGIHKVVVDRTQTGGRDIGEGVIQILEAFKGEEVADERLFRRGVEQLELGFDLIRASLKRQVEEEDPVA